MERLRAETIFERTEADRPSRGEADELRTNTTRGVVWALIANVGSRVLSTAVMVLLARVLSPSDFGLVAIATVAVMVLTVIVDGGLAYALVQTPVMTRSHYDTAFWTSAVTGLGATLIAYVAAEPLAEFFKEPELTSTLRWLSLVLLIAGLSSTPQAVLQRRFQFKALASRLLLANLVGGIVGVVVALRGGGAWALVAQTVVKQLVQAVTVWWACPVRPGTSVTSTTFRPMFRFGLSMMGLQALNSVNKRTDDLLIARNLGKEALGYYNVAYSLLLLLNQLLMQTVSQVVFPLFSRLQHDVDRMRSAIYEVVRLTSLVTFPVYVTVVVVAPDLIATVFGPKWAPAVPVMQVLATVGVPQTLWVFLGSVLVGSGRPSWTFRLNLILTAMLVVGFFISVRWGILAVAISYAICTFAFAPIQMTLVKRVFPFSTRTYVRQFRAPALAAGIMAAVTFAVRISLLDVLPAPARLLVCGIVAPTSYLIVLRIGGHRELREVVDLAARMLPPKINGRLDRLVPPVA